MQAANRILVVTRHIWPCTDDSTLRLRYWLRLFRSERWSATVLTPRWHATWPDRIAVEDSSIIRLNDPPLSLLRQTAYRRHLIQWLNKNGHNFQVILCDQLGEDALATLDWAESQYSRPVPVFVRFDPNELPRNSGDLSLPNSVKTTVRALGNRATGLLVPSQAAHQQLIGLGVPSERVVRYSDWHVPAIDRSTTARRQARKMLGNVNCDLDLHDRERLIVVPGDLTGQWNIEFIIDAIWQLVELRPGLRVWIHGDGLVRDRIYQLLRRFGIHRSVALPGMFTGVDELLRAADLCLFPGPGCGLGYLLPTCIASGIPVLAARSPELTAQLGGTTAPLTPQLTFEVGSVGELQQRLAEWLEQPAGLECAAREAQGWTRQQRAHAEDPHSLIRELRKYLNQPSDSPASRFVNSSTTNRVRLA